MFNHKIEVVSDTRNVKKLLFAYEWMDLEEEIALDTLVHVLETCVKKFRKAVEDV